MRCDYRHCRGVCVGVFGVNLSNIDHTQRAYEATEWLIDNAEALAQAKHDLVEAEAMLRATKALAMKHSNQNAISAQERDAYASPSYKQAIDNLAQAAQIYEAIRARKDAEQAKIEFWRSYNANQRGAERGYGSAG